MPRPLYPQGKSPRYPLDRKLCGPQSRSKRGVEEENPRPRRESKSGRPIGQPKPVAIRTELGNEM
jgi:hypothetical protein